MKFCRLILFFLIVSISAFSQDAEINKSTNSQGKLLIGVNFSPDYCYRTLVNNSDKDYISSFIQNRNNNEIPKFGYTTGLNFRYNISGLIGIETGIQYSTKGYANDLSGFTFGDMIDPRFGFIYQTQNSTSQIPVKFIYNYNYFDIPLRAIFNFGKSKLHFITSIGLTTSILINATETIVSKNDNGNEERKVIDQYGEFETINISPSFSAGINYKIGKRINLSAEPTARYGLIKIMDSDMGEYLWNAGFNISCYYILK